MPGENYHVAIQSSKDLDSRPESHPACSLVEYLINRLIINFPENRPYYPHRVVSGKPFHQPLSVWCLVWIVNGRSVTLDGLSGNSSRAEEPPARWTFRFQRIPVLKRSPTSGRFGLCGR